MADTPAPNLQDRGDLAGWTLTSLLLGPNGRPTLIALSHTDGRTIREEWEAQPAAPERPRNGVKAPAARANRRATKASPK